MRSLVLSLALLMAILLVVGEIAARVFTQTRAVSGSENGMPRFGRIPLLPFRPEAQTVRHWWDVTADSKYVLRDGELGWTIGPSAGSGLYTSNAQGIRASGNHVYDSALPRDKTRIVVVGDSFTHGDESSLEDTWTTQLEKINTNLELVNFGVPGYGTDQAFMRWRRDARKFKSHYVFLGIWPENICRNLNQVRYYLVPAGGFAPKPRFLLENGELKSINSPVPGRDEVVAMLSDPENAQQLKNEYWLRKEEVASLFHYHLRLARVLASVWDAYARRAERNRLYSGEDPSGIDITVAIAKQFSKEVRASGAIPLIMIVPMKELLAAYPGENALPLTASLRKAGVEVIDPTPVFAAKVAQEGAGKYFADHYSPAGNHLLAEEVAKYLAARNRK